jgi:hypothetical protein
MAADERSEASAIQTRHVEVEKHETRPQRISEALHGVNAINSADDGASEFLEARGERGSKIRVVVNEQDAPLTRHA